MGSRAWGAALACGALLAAGLASPALAGGGVVIDTEPLTDTGPGGSLPLSVCALGAATCTPMHLGFSLYRNDGTSFDDVYLYREGVVGLGAPLPVGASVAGGLASLGNSYLAPGFDTYAGENVSIRFETLGGADHGFPNDISDMAMIWWHVVDPSRTIDNPLAGQTDEDGTVEPDTIPWSGSFQIFLLSHAFTSDFGNPGYYPTGDRIVDAEFNYGNEFPDSDAMTGNFPEDGVSSTGKFGYAFDTRGAVFGFPGVTNDVAFPLGPVPEPQSWALMILGFAGLGAVLRRRAAAARHA